MWTGIQAYIFTNDEHDDDDDLDIVVGRLNIYIYISVNIYVALYNVVVAHNFHKRNFMRITNIKMRAYHGLI